MERLELANQRQATETAVNRVNSAHKKIQQRMDSQEPFTVKAAHRLNEMYQVCLNALEREQRLVQELVVQIDHTKHMNDEKKRKRPEEKRVTKKPKTDNDIYSQGQQVAARVSTEWIIATVIAYVADKNKYEVEDADDETHKRYLMSPKYLQPIASDKELITHEFPAQHQVLALYPASTCFYKATVVMPPSATGKSVYIVQFDDDGGFERSVDIRMVLDFPQEE
ncbi:SGF29 tudor-like domain-containing protein [Gorgonomyces haynaldii]|nr:SGF29 tudor-like domain-containing protein [Gorgonomyces haynaldii]